MKTIIELEKGCGDMKLGKEEFCCKEDLCSACNLKIKTLKEVLELIDEKINKMNLEASKVHDDDRIRLFSEDRTYLHLHKKDVEELKSAITGRITNK